MELNELLDKLNQMAKNSILIDIPKTGLIFHPWGDETSTTLCFNQSQDQEFILNPPKASRVELYTGGESKIPRGFRGVAAIHRICFSIAAMKRSVTNAKSLDKALQFCVNQAVIDLTNQLGYLEFKVDLTAKNSDGSYFIYNSENDSIEIRIRALVDCPAAGGDDE